MPPLRNRRCTVRSVASNFILTTGEFGRASRPPTFSGQEGPAISAISKLPCLRLDKTRSTRYRPRHIRNVDQPAFFMMTRCQTASSLNDRCVSRYSCGSFPLRALCGRAARKASPGGGSQIRFTQVRWFNRAFDELGNAAGMSRHDAPKHATCADGQHGHEISR